MSFPQLADKKVDICMNLWTKKLNYCGQNSIFKGQKNKYSRNRFKKIFNGQSILMEGETLNKRNKSNDNLFRKSNVLISAKYDSTLVDNKIMSIALSNIQKTSKDEMGRLVSKISAAELRQIFGDETGSLYGRLDTVAKKLTGRVVGMSDPDNKIFHYTAIVIEADYQDGIFTIYFNPSLQDQIVNIEKKFTLLSLPILMSFNSVYSFRLYELLKSTAFKDNHNCQTNIDGSFDFTMSLSELKLELGVVDANCDAVKMILDRKSDPDYDKAVEAAPEKRLKVWSDFRKRALDVAVNEINEKTDIKISYIPKKSGKGGKIYGLDFNVMYKNDEEQAPSILPKENNMDRSELVVELMDLIEEKITSKDAKSILSAAGDDLELIRAKYSIAKQSGEIKNITAWMIKAIKDDYQPPVEKNNTLRKKRPFSATNDRKYDFDEIEKILVNNK